jgi:hypothetical protein
MSRMVFDQIGLGSKACFVYRSPNCSASIRLMVPMHASVDGKVLMPVNPRVIAWPRLPNKRLPGRIDAGGAARR